MAAAEYADAFVQQREPRGLAPLSLCCRPMSSPQSSSR